MTGYRLGELTSEGFDRFARHVDMLCTEGAARSAARSRRAERAFAAAQAAKDGWLGPKADEFAESTFRASDEFTATEPDIGSAYRALGDAAQEGRTLASAIRDREEEWARKGWHEQAGSGVVEWLGNRVPFVDHPKQVLTSRGWHAGTSCAGTSPNVSDARSELWTLPRFHQRL